MLRKLILDEVSGRTLSKSFTTASMRGASCIASSSCSGESPFDSVLSIDLLFVSIMACLINQLCEPPASCDAAVALYATSHGAVLLLRAEMLFAGTSVGLVCRCAHLSSSSPLAKLRQAFYSIDERSLFDAATEFM